MAKKKMKKEKKENREKSSKYEKQLRSILLIMGLILLTAVIAYFVINSTKSFEYGGIKFQKIMFDKLSLYYSRIPLYNVAGELIAYYNLYLRNDPRKLDISVSDKIKLTQNTVLSVDESINGCEDIGIAGSAIGYFFAAAGINKTNANTNKIIANETGVMHATCDNSLENSVVVIKQGNETAVYKEKPNCYIIEFKDCEINKVTERFIVAAIANSKGISL
jgi:hypothetical protein